MNKLNPNLRTAGYEPLKHGQSFDLGGITLEAIAVPGHTQGMTCILNVEERQSFLATPAISFHMSNFPSAAAFTVDYAM